MVSPFLYFLSHIRCNAISFLQGIWGGESVVKGFQKRTPYKKRVPHYWVPVLRRNVLHSVVLNKYWSTIVTERTMDLIHESHGFDHYLLKVNACGKLFNFVERFILSILQTPACDLQSSLAYRIKRNILQALMNKCPDVTDPKKKSEILNEYSKYLEQVSRWYPILKHSKMFVSILSAVHTRRNRMVWLFI